MPFVKTVPYQQAQGLLKEAYDGMLARQGRISNVYAVSSLRPETMVSLQDHHEPVMQSVTSGLTEAEKQMIATLVSALNKCRY
jgi:alkylhydroperoxidase family enzyme